MERWISFEFLISRIRRIFHSGFPSNSRDWYPKNIIPLRVPLLTTFRKYLCQGKKRECCSVFQQNPLTALLVLLPSPYKFLLFSSHLPLNQTKTRQEGRDSRLFRGLDNSQPPLQETIRRTEERHGRGRRGPARMQITSEAVIPEVGRSVALASCARCKDKSPGETSTRWESNSVSLRSRRRIQVGPPPPFRFLADATLNPPPPVIELGFYTTLRRYTWNTVKTTRSVYTVTRKRN